MKSYFAKYFNLTGNAVQKASKQEFDCLPKYKQQYTLYIKQGATCPMSIDDPFFLYCLIFLWDKKVSCYSYIYICLMSPLFLVTVVDEMHIVAQYLNQKSNETGGVRISMLPRM